MTCVRIPGGFVCVQPEFKPGDPAPEGYLAWHEWAEVQRNAGLKQKQCGRCGKWHFPQGLSETVDRTEFTATRKGKGQRVVKETPVCKECEGKKHEHQ